MSARTETPETQDAVERAWWGRLPQLITSPRAFFSELRDESREAADARQEPLLAVSVLAGFAMFLALATLEPPYGRFDSLSGLNLTLETILGGMIVALSNVWLGGVLVYLGARGLGATSGYRLARHITGFATAPFVLSLVLVVPVRVGLYGMSLFRVGGGDEGAGGDVFIGIDAALLVWTIALVLIGIRETQRWPWQRALGALGVVALFAIVFGTFVYSVSK